MALPPQVSSQPGSPVQDKAPAPTAKPGFGSSSASQATPNDGYDAAGAQMVAVLISMMQQVLLKVTPTSELGKVVLEAMNKLVKAVPAGTASPASQNAMLDQAKMQNTQNMAIQQQLRQRAMAGGAGGGQPPAGGPPSMGAAA